MEEIPDYKRNDEIDLIDILGVLIKRKWIIIGFILTAFIFSGLYVIFKNIKDTQEVNEIQSYKSSVIITLPQVYTIKPDNLLVPNISRVDIILKRINDNLNLKSYKQNNDVQEYYYNYEINIVNDPVGNKLIKISIAGQKREIIKAISYLYSLYTSYESEINEKNQKNYEFTQNTLQKNLEQKTKLLDKYTFILNQEELPNLPFGSTIINNITALSSKIPTIEKTKELNEMVKLLKGDFKLLKDQREIIINKDNLVNIEYYLQPEDKPVKSKKRQLLPVIISVFLAFFVGVFLAFIIEFFSREDVKRRLKKIKEK